MSHSDTVDTYFKDVHTVTSMYVQLPIPNRNFVVDFMPVLGRWDDDDATAGTGLARYSASSLSSSAGSQSFSCIQLHDLWSISQAHFDNIGSRGSSTFR